MSTEVAAQTLISDSHLSPSLTHSSSSLSSLSSLCLGGLGLQLLDEVIVAEETAYGCTGITTALATNMLAVSPHFTNHVLHV